jgi:hypothetical protein
MQAEEAQLLSTKITGYVINETAVFGFCLDWRSWGASIHAYRRRTTTLRMGITCVIECFRVLAYYRCHDEINNTWADFFCFVRLSLAPSSSSLSTLLSNYKLHIVRLSCPPSAFAGRRVVCGRAAKTDGQADLSLKSTKSGSSHRLPGRGHKHKSPDCWCLGELLLQNFTCSKPLNGLAPCQPPLSTGGRNCFFIFFFFATRQEERIFFTPY